MKILLVPWGRGMGHVTRCLTIAEQAIQNIGPGQVYIVVEDQWDMIALPVGCAKKSFPQELLSLGPWDKWDDIHHIQQSLAADLQVLEEVKPDIVVNDIRPTMNIACEFAGIPCITIAQCVHHPDYFFPDPFWTEVVVSFNTVLKECRLPCIKNDLRELYFRTAAFIPSIPEFDPLPEGSQETRVWYTGPLLLNAGNRPSIPILHGASEVPGIFIYGVVQTQEDVDQLLHAFRDEPFHLVVTGLPTNLIPQLQKYDTTRISIHSFINVPSILSKCAAAIIHGGHGSCMASLVSGTPALVLPASEKPERIINGNRLEAMGVARCIPGNVVWAEVCNEMKQMIKDPIYRENAQKWQKHLRHWAGPKVAWKILTDLVQDHEYNSRD